MIKPMHDRIPVHIVTGFLGAGKTTFLNHLIRSRVTERLIVIENEVGETNIDGALVIEGVEEVLELTAGCLCCSLNDELEEMLATLALQGDRFDRLIIETTGIADPGAVAQTFLSNPAVERVFDLKNVICLADALFLDDALRDTDEARRQIASADIILLNKTDLVEPAQTSTLYTAVRGINPLAEVMFGQEGMFDIKKVLDIEAVEHEGAERQTDRVPEHHQHLHHDITSFTLSYEGEFDLSQLSHQLLVLLNVYRHQVYRVKGIVASEGSPTKVVLQSVRNMLGMSDGSLWQPDEPRQSKIVFIGKGVHRQSIERILNPCLKKPVPPKSQSVLTGRPSSNIDFQKIKFG